MPLIIFGISFIPKMAHFEGCAVREKPKLLTFQPDSAEPRVNLLRPVLDFFQLLIGAPEKYAASILPVTIGMNGKIAEHAVGLAAAARAAIKNLKYRACDECGLRSRLWLPDGNVWSYPPFGLCLASHASSFSIAAGASMT